MFGNKLGDELAAYSAIIPPEVIQGVKQSVTVIFMLPEPLRGLVIKSYVAALDWTFIVGVPACGLAIVAALFVKNWDLKARGALGVAAV